jgi:hypothetical protein
LNAVDGKRGAELPGGGVGRAGGIDQHDAAVLAAAGEAKLAIGQTDDTGRERESVGHGARMVGKILDLLALEDRWGVGLLKRRLNHALHGNAFRMDGAEGGIYAGLPGGCGVDGGCEVVETFSHDSHDGR